MNIDIPWLALVGGALIGLSASVLLLFSGKVAGISGIIGGLLQPQQGDIGWRLSMLLGMLLSVFLVKIFGLSLPTLGEQNWLLLSGAGLLVGFGTCLGNGCTSGHGVVGMARLSPRSLVATLVFMISAALVVFIKNILGGE